MFFSFLIFYLTVSWEKLFPTSFIRRTVWVVLAKMNFLHNLCSLVHIIKYPLKSTNGYNFNWSYLIQLLLHSSIYEIIHEYSSHLTLLENLHYFILICIEAYETSPEKISISIICSLFPIIYNSISHVAVEPYVI